MERAACEKSRKEAVHIAESLKWRDVDRKTEVFVMDELPAEQAWTTFKLRDKDTSLHDIYRLFFSGDIINRLGRAARHEDFELGSRKTKLSNGKFSRTTHMMRLTKKYITQATAICFTSFVLKDLYH